MKKTKVGLRIWIATVSVLGFLFGWGMFAHSNKPAPLFGLQNQPVISANLQPLPTLTPLNGLQTGVQSIQPQQLPQLAFQPRLRTSGS